MIKILENILEYLGVSAHYIDILTVPIFILIVILISYLSIKISEKILTNFFLKLVKKSKTDWDNILYEKGFFRNVSYIIPAIIILTFIESFGALELFFQKIALVYIAVVFILAISSFLSALDTIYQEYEISKERPIKGYLQIIKVIAIIISVIISIGTLIEQSPWKLLSGIGAFTAVLLLVFRDSLLGLVAGIQISGNKLIKIGDWIEMQNHGADGEVIEININKILVRNWDKTITSVPVYAFVAESFKNWQGMIDSNARRIKKHIIIDIDSVKICDKDFLDKLKRNDEFDETLLDDNFNNTNLYLFRKHLHEYIKNHKKVRADMIILVRLLQQNENGIPLEIYCFADEIRWAFYEDISSSIIEYAISTAREFDLKIFQRISKSDLDVPILD